MTPTVRRRVEACSSCGRPTELLRVAGTGDLVKLDARVVWLKPRQDDPGRLFRPSGPGQVEPVERGRRVSPPRRDSSRADGPFRVAHADTCPRRIRTSIGTLRR